MPTPSPCRTYRVRPSHSLVLQHEMSPSWRRDTTPQPRAPHPRPINTGDDRQSNLGTSRPLEPADLTLWCEFSEVR